MIAAILLSLIPITLDVSPTTFVVHSASGDPIRGPIQSIAGDGTVTLGGKNAGVCSGEELLSMTRADGKIPSPPRVPHIVLTNGDQLPAEVMGIDQDIVKIRARLGGTDSTQELKVPLAAMAVIWFRPPPAIDADSPLLKVISERRRRDVIVLANGDTRSGSVLSLDGENGALRYRDGSRDATVERPLVAAIAFSTDLSRSFRPKGPYLRMTLANGTRLSLQNAVADERTLNGKTTFGESVRVAMSQLIAIERRQGRFVFLSDQKPARYDHTPYLGASWPYRPDANVTGTEMRLGGSYFDKGIGMHSESRLTYRLNGDYRRFESIVGLDDLSGQRGQVRAKVVVDGKDHAVGTAGQLGAGHPVFVSVDVSGARELTLVVEFGSGGDVQDHVNWANARLVK